MKISISYNEAERHEINNFICGFAPLKSLFSDMKPKNKMVTTMIELDKEKEIRTATININSKYATNVIGAYAQYMPMISTTVLSFCTTIRGLVLALQSISKKYSETEHEQPVNKAA